MLRVIGKRLALLVPTLLGLSVLLFAWVRALPGGPATALLGDKATPEAVARINEVYGFDRPLLEQYVVYTGQLLRGDFGASIVTGRPVVEEFLTRFPATLELSLVALVFAVGIGVPLGYVAARHRGRLLDHSSVVLSLLGVTVPVFFLAFILKWLLAIQVPLFPADGRQDPRIDATHHTNFFVLDGLLTGEWDAAWDALLHLVLPGVALGTIPLAIIVRITRASVLEVQSADYVRTARAKGLTRGLIRGRYILRNAMLPVVTTIGLQTGLLISGAVLTETVFAFNGIGRFLRDAIFTLDYPVLQGFIIFIALAYSLINLLVDISYSLIDPRVRVQ
ncbi:MULTISPECIES: ABC transporter permease [Kocuria]|jgi:peptide/nickel transport system permease protein|uniref:ABC transporter permease n=1 Tax=Kocuria TaxID=57493 RepID=UPI0003810944|nr:MULTISPECIES: ABC transporter permease [Kocuria]MCC5784241.1 ABC transporter permease [Kocuria sp. CCUG 69068]EYT54486.1 peptide ABC transporter permease [Kocuria sp. UCD-OTCP]MEB2526602.1 ABC transporter permease [Kocuria rosea]MEB2620315.1 ABC transporter permease [Kocuria rosea]PAU91960.1 ABC transporter permease [Kocuria sp. WN036]